MTTSESISDEELVEQTRERDPEMYREIIVRYQSKLLRYAEKITNNRESAADVVQQAFIKAYKNLHGFNINRKFSSWIYRIVHNEAINYIKKHQREIKTSDMSIFDRFGGSDTTNEVVDELEAREMQKNLLDKIEQLPVKYKAPLLLFFYEDKSYEEISDILRIPTGTVGTQINRGKKQLKELIEENHE